MQISTALNLPNRLRGAGGFGAGAALALDFTSGNQTLDSRITFTRSTTATRFNRSGVLETVAIDSPRFDYDPVTLAPKGLLIEEARTNSIRNSTMVGAVTGSPGTLPTNWNVTGAGTGTLTRTIVGSGVVNGMTYVDIRWNGVTSTTGFGTSFEPAIGVSSAVSGQTWTASVYLGIVDGSVTNITAIRAISLQGRDSSGNATADGGNTGDQKSVLTSTLQKFSLTTTLAAATTASLQQAVGILFNSGVSIDITLRIAAPQLEQGAFATSYIPTSTVAVQRTADTAVMTSTNFSSWYNASEGTVYSEFSAIGFTFRPFFFNDGTANNSIGLTLTASNAAFDTYVGGTFQGPAGVVGTFNVGTVYKQAGAYKLNDGNVAVNGSTGTTDTSYSLPTVNQATLGAKFTSGTPGNGYIRRLAFYNRRMTNAELGALTG